MIDFVMPQDAGVELQERVATAYRLGQPLRIQCGNSKAFYGESVSSSGCSGSESAKRKPLVVGEVLDLRQHRGIIDYDPQDGVITVRAGTPLRQVNALLAEHGQILGFEPPHFSEQASVGGCVACGLSGSARPFLGSVRDHMLGCSILNGKGERLRFGGKRVGPAAGLDVARLMVGAMGSLGVLLEISLKTLPAPEVELTLALPTGTQEALDVMSARAGKPLPLTALAYDGEAVLQRLAGSAAAVKQARRKLAGDEISSGRTWWEDVREQRHYFFQAPFLQTPFLQTPFLQTKEPLWRLSLAPATLPLGLPGSWFYDWGGALRWFYSAAPYRHIRAAVEAEGGHACLFRNERGIDGVPIFHPLPSGLGLYQRRLKQLFDPACILNPGRLYRDSECRSENGL